MPYLDLLLPEKGTWEWELMIDGKLEQCEACGTMFDPETSPHIFACSDECQKILDEEN